MSDQLNMSVSQICSNGKEKYAFVSFTDGKRVAEGKIPACKIMKNEGFSEAEVAQLELYMKQQLNVLKKMAAGINVMDAFLGKTQGETK